MEFTPAPPSHLANASAVSVLEFLVAKLCSAKYGKNTRKSVSSSFVLTCECINVGVFGQGESVVASPLFFSQRIPRHAHHTRRRAVGGTARSITYR